MLKCIKNLENSEISDLVSLEVKEQNEAPQPGYAPEIFCLFDLILYVPSTIFQLNS